VRALSLREWKKSAPIHWAIELSGFGLSDRGAHRCGPGVAWSWSRSPPRPVDATLYPEWTRSQHQVARPDCALLSLGAAGRLGVAERPWKRRGLHSRGATTAIVVLRPGAACLSTQGRASPSEDVWTWKDISIPPSAGNHPSRCQVERSCCKERLRHERSLGPLSRDAYSVTPGALPVAVAGFEYSGRYQDKS
jgi:hypothetical protein